MNDSQVSNAPKLIGIGIGAVMLIAMAVFYFMNKNDSTALYSTRPYAATSTNAASANSSNTATAPVKDGVYTATSRYMVPHGMNSITVKLTVKDGAITDVQTDNKYTSGESAGYISDFKDSISGVVVGKKLSNLSIYNTSGASDTTQGFNDALQQIEDQAQA